jgi:hypothetical protein
MSPSEALRIAREAAEMAATEYGDMDQDEVVYELIAAATIGRDRLRKQAMTAAGL